MESLQLSPLDLRLGLMAAVLAVMAVVFHLLTGTFLTPENLYDIAQQTAVVGIVATAIGLVVVGRHIDLSVGSVMGFVGVLIAWLQYSHGWHWLAACGAGLLAAIAVGLYQGGLTAYLGVPSFVVTLGGLMSFRGAAFLVADGKTQPVTDPVFLWFGGGLDGALGIAGSWALAAVLALLACWRMVQARRAKARHGFPLRPLAADLAFTAALLALLGAFTAAMCAYQLPTKPHGQGVPVPVVIWGAVVIAVAFLVRRTRFGRYIYAIGNKEAAAYLAGVNTRRVTVICFILCGLAAALAGVLLAGYSTKAYQAMGDTYLLPSIAAVVIGGTNILGGRGRYLGTLVGVVLIVLLNSVLSIMAMPEAGRQVIYGLVIILMLLVYGRGERVTS